MRYDEPLEYRSYIQSKGIVIKSICKDFSLYSSLILTYCPISIVKTLCAVLEFNAALYNNKTSIWKQFKIPSCGHRIPNQSNTKCWYVHILEIIMNVFLVNRNRNHRNLFLTHSIALSMLSLSLFSENFQKYGKKWCISNIFLNQSKYMYT